MKKILTIMLLLIACATTKAQDDPEYRMEIGAGAGMMSYLGDFNGSLTSGMKPMATVLARRVFNPYSALRLAVSTGKIEGSSANVETLYPDFLTQPYTFDGKIYDVGLAYEYHFWPYGTGRDYRGAKRLVPYMMAGLGLTIADVADKSKAAMNIPLGIGLKYKASERLNVGLEWAVHFCQSDELDGQKDPYYIKSSGLFKNTDGYSRLQLTLTYSFAAKCVTCNKE